MASLCSSYGMWKLKGPAKFIALANGKFRSHTTLLIHTSHLIENTLLKQLGTTNSFTEESILILESQLLGHGSQGYHCFTLSNPRIHSVLTIAQKPNKISYVYVIQLFKYVYVFSL